ncbi:HDIG domain-containing protein, partial [archaeon]|nr:HDIG domain-containing protein [archaeon]
VQRLTLEMASKIKSKGHEIDIEFVRTAALLHDIGRFRCKPGTAESIKHGVAGAEILRSEGIDARYALVCERHLGAGISKEDVKEQKLPLPLRDYTPQSIEEKVIAHADNLLWGIKAKTIKDVVERFTKEIGPECGKKVQKLNDELEGMMK